MNKPEYAYFLGAGGIGMSALIRHLLQGGVQVHGYDKTPSLLTDALIDEGAVIHFHEDVNMIPGSWLEAPENNVLWIYTPAIPSNHLELQFLKSCGKKLIKRSQLLGILTQNTFNISIGGTHGKTTTSCLIATLLSKLDRPQSAFLGGVSADLGSNYYRKNAAGSELSVCEADEFDRSFLQLNPDVAVITSVDPDHLDIYQEAHSVTRAYREFADKIKPGGVLFCRTGLTGVLEPRTDLQVFEYGLHTGTFHATELRFESGKMKFNLIGPSINWMDIELGIPGLHNIENAIAAIAVAISQGCDEESIRRVLSSFKGVKRRFEFVIQLPDKIMIDDYAHHPTELEAVIKSVRLMFPGKIITGVFQPHLYSRTRDFALEFTKALSLLDRLLLMDIYPAREEPIEGVNSEILLKNIGIPAEMVGRTELPERICTLKPEVLLCLGAGDIDREISKLKEAMLCA